MKKSWFYVLSLSILVLTACGNAEDTSTDEESNETAELEEENEELRKQLDEQDDEEESALEDTDEENANSEPEASDDTEHSNETGTQDDNSKGNQSDLVFDINSPEVQSQLIGTSNTNPEGSFQQDAITVGMTQTEVEEKYGPYEFSFYMNGASPAFYGNLAVVYSNRAPYGEGDDGSESNIDPDENTVESVYYYAGVTEDEMTDALGEPDERDDGSQSMNGLPHYVYQGTGDDGRYYITGASTINTPDGETIGLIMREVFDENPNEAGQSTVDEEDIPVTEEPDPNAEIKDDDEYEYLLTEYLNRLAAHYNMNEYEDVYYYLKRDSAAYDKIAANKESGHFTGHETIDVELIEMTDLGDGTVELNANRVYSHDNSEGQRIANVNYIVNAETHEVLDFEPVSDEAY